MKGSIAIGLAVLALAVIAAAPARAGGGRPEFTGTWRLDLDASEPLDALLEVQGRSWIERKVARSMNVTQKIRQAGDTITIAVESALRTKVDVFAIGGPWEERTTDELGRVRVKTEWNADGKRLVVRNEAKLKDGTEGELRISRWFEDGGKTMVQLVELDLKDGRHPAARRVFRRVGTAPDAPVVGEGLPAQASSTDAGHADGVCRRKPAAGEGSSGFGSSKECRAGARLWGEGPAADKNCRTADDCEVVSANTCFHIAVSRAAADRYRKTAPCPNPAAGACANRPYTTRCADSCCELSMGTGGAR